MLGEIMTFVTKEICMICYPFSGKDLNQNKLEEYTRVRALGSK